MSRKLGPKPKSAKLKCMCGDFQNLHHLHEQPCRSRKKVIIPSRCIARFAALQSCPYFAQDILPDNRWIRDNLLENDKRCLRQEVDESFKQIFTVNVTVVVGIKVDHKARMASNAAEGFKNQITGLSTSRRN